LCDGAWKDLGLPKGSKECRSAIRLGKKRSDQRPILKEWKRDVAWERVVPNTFLGCGEATSIVYKLEDYL
jgi:hypothetical protein